MVRAPATFLVGAPRSGTSLLYRALCLHPDAAWISNWVRRAPGLPQLAVLNRVAPRLPAVRRRVWFGAEGSNAYRYAERRSPLDRLFPQPVEGEPLFERCGIAATPAPGPPDLVAARCLADSLAAVQRWSGGHRLVVKRIANNVRVPLLAAAFPDARFVEVTRDGRAVAVSLHRVDWWPTSPVWWYGGTPADWAAEGRDPWELCARHWVEEVRALDAGLAGVADDRVLRLRYEDVVADPRGTLAEVANAAGLDPADGRWQRALDGLSFPDRTEGWRAAEPAALAVIEKTLAEELAARGYAP